MSPPQLAADAPVLDVAHPGEIGVFPLLRHELDGAVLDGGNGRFGQLPGIDVPLVGQVGFYYHPGAVPAGYPQTMGLDLVHQAQGLQVRDHAPARLEAIQPPVGCRRLLIDGGIVVEDIDHRQAVAAAHLIVVEIVGRGYLDDAGAEFAVHVVVRYDRNLAPGQGQFHHAADQVLVALILRVDGHGGVAEHGFRPGGRHGQVTFAARQRVLEVPQLTLFFFLDDFQVRDGGVQYRVPVDQALAAVDQALAVQADKHFLYRLAEAGVHGEALP